MDACICKMSQIKITSRALFWLDQNYQFSYSNYMFFGVIKYVLQKQPITLWKLVILIQSKKGTRCDFYLGHFTYTSIHLLDSMNGMLGTFFFYQCYFATAVYLMIILLNSWSVFIFRHLFSISTYYRQLWKNAKVQLYAVCLWMYLGLILNGYLIKLEKK